MRFIFASQASGCFLSGMDRDAQRWGQIGRGVAVVLLVFLVVAALFSLQFLPGPVGETARMLFGLILTPFVMETSFCIIGFCVVVLLNHYRRKWDGDEFVSLNEAEPVGAGVISSRAVRSSATPVDLRRALANGDHTQALEILADMPDADRALPEVVKMRIELAKESGMTDLAKRLENTLLAGAGSR